MDTNVKETGADPSFAERMNKIAREAIKEKYANLEKKLKEQSEAEAMEILSLIEGQAKSGVLHSVYEIRKGSASQVEKILKAHGLSCLILDNSQNEEIQVSWEKEG